MKPKILILGDCHFPYHSEKALKEALYAVKHEKPTHVVQIGDLYDQFVFSRFTKKNIQMPEAELESGRERAVRMWSSISSTLGKSGSYIQLLGNHDVRLIKRLAEKIPEAQEILGKSFLKEYYTFKGVQTIEDDREIHTVGRIAFHHGFLSKLGDHLRYFGSSVVVGHSHVGGVVYEQRAGEILWELNAGYLADETAEPLKYRPTKSCKWTLGFGLVDGYGARFIPV